MQMNRVKFLRLLFYSRTKSYFRIQVFGLNIYFSRCSLTRRKRGNVKAQRSRKLQRLRYKWLKEGRRCEICGCTMTVEDSSLHHIKPQSQYPELKYRETNLMLLCNPCHINLHKELNIKESRNHGI